MSLISILDDRYEDAEITIESILEDGKLSGYETFMAVYDKILGIVKEETSNEEREVKEYIQNGVYVTIDDRGKKVVSIHFSFDLLYSENNKMINEFFDNIERIIKRTDDEVEVRIRAEWMFYAIGAIYYSNILLNIRRLRSIQNVSKVVYVVSSLYVTFDDLMVGWKACDDFIIDSDVIILHLVLNYINDECGLGGASYRIVKDILDELVVKGYLTEEEVEDGLVGVNKFYLQKIVDMRGISHEQ